MTVYLLHFTNSAGKARHYLGWTGRTAETRFAEHLSGTGCKYTSKLVAEGFVPQLAYVFADKDRKFEYRLKQLSRADPQYSFGRWCPLCGNMHYLPTDDQVMNWKKHAGKPRFADWRTLVLK